MEKVSYVEDEEILEVQETIKEAPQVVTKCKSVEVAKIHELKKVTEAEKQTEEHEGFRYKSKENPILCNLLQAESKATILSKMKQEVLEQSLRNKLEEKVLASQERDTKIKALMSEKENLQKQLNSEQSQRSQIFNEMENTGLMIMMLKEHTKYVSDQYELHLADKNILEAKIKEQTVSFEAFKSNITNHINKNRAVIKQLKEDNLKIDLELCSDLTNNQLSEMENDVKQLKASYDSKMLEKKEKVANLELCKEELGKLEKSRNQLETTLKNIQMPELISKYKEKKDTQEKNVKNVETKILNVRNRVEEIKRQNEQTQQLLDDGIKRTMDLESKNISLEEEFKLKETEKKNLSELLKNTKEQFLKVMDENRTKQKHFIDNLENIDHNMVAVVQDNTNLLKNIQESLENKHNILIQAAKLKLRKEHLESEINKKETKLSNLQHRTNNMQSNLNKLESALEDITQKLNEAEEKQNIHKTEHKNKLDEAKKKCLTIEEQFKEKTYLLKQQKDFQKILNDKIIQETREANNNKLKQMTDCIENLKQTVAQETREKEQLGIKLKAKKDALCKLVTMKQKLLKESELLKRKYENSSQNPVADNVVPISILKSPRKVQLPSKRVSFQQNLVWDSLSEDGSSDAVLNELLNIPNTSEEIQRVSKTNDEMLPKSPPEKLV